VKILLIGHPGSGKTHLANMLSNKTGIENIDIDGIFDTNPYRAFSKRLYEKALDKILTDKKDYVVDGYHVGIMPDNLWVDADIIIYLNLPKNELKQNVLTRYKQKKSSKEFSHWQAVRINNLKNYTQIRFQDKALQKDVARIKGLMGETSQFYELKSKEDIKNFMKGF
jgi:adenylate kinase family enzyme